MRFERDDLVRVNGGGPEVYRVMQPREADNLCLLQLGNDGAKIQWRKEDELELVEKAKKPDEGARFVPDRGIMG